MMKSRFAVGLVMAGAAVALTVGAAVPVPPSDASCIVSGTPDDGGADVTDSLPAVLAVASGTSVAQDIAEMDAITWFWAFSAGIDLNANSSTGLIILFK